MWRLIPALTLALVALACDGAPAESIFDGDVAVQADAADAATDAAADAPSDTAADTSTDPGPPPCFAPGRVWNIAHRGGRLLRPEHTLLAYENALAVGADAIELDLHRTADGVVVVMHDETVSRTTDGTGPIAGLTLAELKALDAGYDFSLDGGATFPYRGQGLTVPTLDEVLSRFGGVCMSLELKDPATATADAATALLDAHQLSDRVLLISFADEPLHHLRALRPDLLTGFSAAEMFEFFLLDDDEVAAWTPPAPLIQPPFEQMDEAMMTRARTLGLIVQPWTVNQPADMQALIDRGVDGLITDDPATLSTLLDP